MKLFHFFIVLFFIIYIGAGIAVAATTPKITSYQVEVFEQGSVKVSWSVEPAPDPDKFIMVIYRGTDKLHGYALPSESEGTLQGNVGDSFKFELKEIATGKILDTKSAKVLATGTAGSAPQTQESCKQQTGATGYQFCNTLFGDHITAPDYVAKFYTWSVGIAIFGASLMIIYAGYRYTMSRGNPSEISSAKEIIVSSLVGLALLLLSYTILRFIGVNVLDPSKKQNQTTNSQQGQPLP